MKNKTLLFAAAVFSSLFLFCGCSLISPEVKAVNYYDLSFNGKNKLILSESVVLYNVRNISPVKLNMAYSAENGSLVVDQYNFWAQSPENMLHRFILNAVSFKSPANEKTIGIYLTIFDFKLDAVGKKCILGIECKMERKNSENEKKWHKIYTVETPVESIGRNEFVRGMNNCAEQFVIQLVKDIKKF